MFVKSDHQFAPFANLLLLVAKVAEMDLKNQIQDPNPSVRVDLDQFDYTIARDALEKNDQYKNRTVYSLPVRIENWNEDLFLTESKLLTSNNKRVRCELLVEKMRAMIKNLFEPVRLAKDRPFIEYGRVYQIQACSIPDTIIPQGTFGLYLSGLMTETDLDHGTHFMHGCKLSASPDKGPCVRNSFIIKGCRSNKDTEPVMYGEDIYIQIYESGICTPLYVQCENSTYDNFGTHLIPHLTQSPDLYCRFKIFHWDPNLRYETEGSSFAPDQKVVIRHTASGQNLAVQHNQWMPTLFGPECLVTCHTFRDTHKMETAENIWTIKQYKKVDKNVFIRAAKGEYVPAEFLE